MADHKSETIEISGCKTAILRGGSGPTLLFLHGAGGAGAWAPYMDALAENFDVIVPSHPGFGASDTPDWLDNMSDLAFFYLDLMTQLDLTNIHLVGNSLGGWLAMEVAVRSTQRIKSLTLVSAAGIHVKGVPKGDIFLWDPETRVRNNFVNQDLADARLAVVPSDAEADIALKNHFTTAKLAWQPRFYNPDLYKWLHRIDVPTMILWGDGDKIFPPPYGHALAALIPGAELRVIADCGHLPHQEKLDEFLAGVNDNAGAAS
jgi:pimeloyl-ACP methyl ester carboxylesterase